MAERDAQIINPGEPNRLSDCRTYSTDEADGFKIGVGGRSLDDLCRRAFGVHGAHAQRDHLVEECGELIVALMKLERPDTADALDHVAEEIADVQLMTSQVIFTFGLKKSVERWRQEKLARLQALLDEALP